MVSKRNWNSLGYVDYLGWADCGKEGGKTGVLALI
jgi:hypothetical protein